MASIDFLYILSYCLFLIKCWFLMEKKNKQINLLIVVPSPENWWNPKSAPLNFKQLSMWMLKEVILLDSGYAKRICISSKSSLSCNCWFAYLSHWIQISMWHYISCRCGFLTQLTEILVFCAFEAGIVLPHFASGWMFLVWF